MEHPILLRFWRIYKSFCSLASDNIKGTPYFNLTSAVWNLLFRKNFWTWLFWLHFHCIWPTVHRDSRTQSRRRVHHCSAGQILVRAKRTVDPRGGVKRCPSRAASWEHSQISPQFVLVPVMNHFVNGPLGTWEKTFHSPGYRPQCPIYIIT